jgi:hypothetical protein
MRWDGVDVGAMKFAGVRHRGGIDGALEPEARGAGACGLGCGSLADYAASTAIQNSASDSDEVIPRPPRSLGVEPNTRRASPPAHLTRRKCVIFLARNVASPGAAIRNGIRNRNRNSLGASQLARLAARRVPRA